MSIKIPRPILATLTAVLLLFLAERASAQNGIFADFTTSLGNFTCQLDYTNAPKTVANFIGLATGQRPWLDLPSGRSRTNAFYNGLTFHRVIANFMIQGGSPNGQGTDGPGYAFLDEFSPKLTFNNYGVLAMANSGKNSNGSQFFITVVSNVLPNNVYAIFGQLVSGSNVVYAISRVATDANDKPLTNVVIQQVAIRRVGTAAQAFDINAQGLPVVTNLPLKIAKSGTQFSVSYSNRLYADNRLYATTNLTGSWNANLLGIETATPTNNAVVWTNSGGQQFFRFAQVQYAASTWAPKTLYGRTLALVFTNYGTDTITFNSTNTGTYNFGTNGNGTVTSYAWNQDPYRGFLWPIYFDHINPMTLKLECTNATSGVFGGTMYGSFSSWGVGGSFTLSP